LRLKIQEEVQRAKAEEMHAKAIASGEALREAKLQVQEQEYVRLQLELELGKEFEVRKSLVQQVQQVVAEKDAAQTLAVKFRTERKVLSKTVRALQAKAKEQQQQLKRCDTSKEESLELLTAELRNEQLEKAMVASELHRVKEQYQQQLAEAAEIQVERLMQLRDAQTEAAELRATNRVMQVQITQLQAAAVEAEVMGRMGPYGGNKGVKSVRMESFLGAGAGDTDQSMHKRPPLLNRRSASNSSFVETGSNSSYEDEVQFKLDLSQSAAGANRDHQLEYNELVTRFYAKHNPQKIGDVPSIMSTWRGREKDLLQALQQKYGVGLL
jgi:hypothetical protein